MSSENIMKATISAITLAHFIVVVSLSLPLSIDGQSIFDSHHTEGLGGGFYQNELLGTFYSGFEPFIYSYETQEWLWISGAGESIGYYFWRFAAGHWGWSATDYYPYYFRFSESLWRRYIVEGPLQPAGMVMVEGGTLSTNNELDGASVSTFYIGIYEVTWGEWKTVRNWAAANGYDIGSRGAGCADDHPVHTVAWYDVVKWSNAKSEMEGLAPVYTVSGGSTYRAGQPPNSSISQNLSAVGYRLPLEAEWEFAARGGIQSNGYTYAGSNDLNAVGWYRDNSSGAECNFWSGLGTWPVGQKAPNELGLYDMTGNVLEWCWDMPETHSSYRHFRGSGWISNARDCTVAKRFAYYPDGRIDFYGFRLARSSGH